MGNKLISVDLTKVHAAIAAALPHTADMERIRRGLGAAGMAYWKRTAQSELRSSSRDYVNGLQHIEHKDKIELVLTGQVPNMIEQGWSGGDLREWLLKGPNAKQGKNGPYNTVPFRHGTPGTTERNVGRQMPKAIHNEAKKLAPTLSRPGGIEHGPGGRSVVYGERLHLGRALSKQARAILERKEKPWHATSIYMGMIRKGKHITGGKIQTTGYTTFRRISKFSRGEKHWMHPGIKARDFASRVQDHVAQLAQEIVAAAMAGKS